MWNRAGDELACLELRKPAHHVRFLAAAALVVVVAAEIRVLSSSGRMLMRLPGHGDLVPGIAMHTESGVLASGRRNRAEASGEAAS